MNEAGLTQTSESVCDPLLLLKTFSTHLTFTVCTNSEPLLQGFQAQFLL